MASLEATPFEMPQRPEFFMGGGALFSTPRNYINFLQMLLNQGTFNGAQVLKPETVALMGQNHIGDLNVVTLKTIRPELSNDANFFPDMQHKWGLSFDINTGAGAGRAQPRQPVLGRAVQHLFLDRSDQARDRHDHDPAAAVRRRGGAEAVRAVRKRPVRRAKGGLIRPAVSERNRARAG